MKRLFFLFLSLLQVSSPAVHAGACGQSFSSIHNRTFENDLDLLYLRAADAKKEIDAITIRLAQKNAGLPVFSPLKSRSRAVQKIWNEYGGEVGRISDIARSTVMVSEGQLSNVARQLESLGARVRIVSGDTDLFGYSGVNAKLMTKAGVMAEIQVSTPEMIFAKMPKDEAVSILGQDLYFKIASSIPVDGGLGHVFYEKARILPPDSPEFKELARQSREYYRHFRK